MFDKAFKSISPKKKTEESEKSDKSRSETKPTILDKSQDFINLVSDKFDKIRSEFYLIKEKCNNLLETNYKLGLKHLENGNLREATFRFRFIKKFWPQHLDSQYQLAYCLALSNKKREAKEILEKILAKDPSYNQQAKDLLNNINSNKEENYPSGAGINPESNTKS